MPKISVIIPVYNVEKYLRECLDSVRAQTFNDIEIICVDDGSTDDSPAILDEYAAKDKRFRICHQRNEGPGPARNHALDLAKGQYVCFMDPDDKYPSNLALEKLFDAVSTSGLDVAGGIVSLVSDSGEKMGFSQCFGSGVIPYQETQQQYNYQAYLFSRKLIETEHIRFPNLRRRQDPPFFVAAMIAASVCCYISEPVYEYRLRTSRPKIDWTADGGVRLKDNVTGISLVADLAERNGLEKLFQNNARSLFFAYSPVFQTESEINLLKAELKLLVLRFCRTGLVPRSLMRECVRNTAKRVPNRFHRFAARSRIFGFRLTVETMFFTMKAVLQQWISNLFPTNLGEKV